MANTSAAAPPMTAEEKKVIFASSLGTVNLGGLGFFVVRSLDFIRPARRLTLLKSYLANTAWRRQLHDLMMTNQWQNASAYGHLPKRIGDNAIFIPGLSFERPILSRQFKGERTLHDIRLGLLNVVLKRRHATQDELDFLPSPGERYEGGAALAAGPQNDLSWIERVLIRLAFRFTRPDRRMAPPSTETILGEAAGDLVSLLEAARYDEFRARLDDAVALHALLYALAQEPPEAGKTPFNYAAMEADFFGTIGRTWARTYLPLIRRVGEPLDADGRFYEACSHLPARLQRRVRAAPFDATEILFELPNALFRATVTGAARRHAEASPNQPTPGALFTVAGSGSEFYRRNWLSFVAGWEGFGEIHASVSDEQQGDWKALSTTAPAVKHHLRDSALMVALAAQIGETQAIGWSTDQLLKWRDKMAQGRHGLRHGYALHRPLATLALAGQPWDAVAARPLMMFDEAAVPAEVFGAAVDNAWVDTLTVLTCSLIGVFGPVAADGRIGDGAGAAAGALFRNLSFDPGASTHPRSPPLTTRSVLESILRLAGAGETLGHSYAGEISDLAEKIRDLKGPNYVSARLYSWTGLAGFEGQAETEVLLLAATIENLGRRRAAIVIGDGLKALLLPDDDRVRRRLLDHLAALREASAKIDVTHGRAVIATLRSQDITVRALADRLSATIDLLVRCEAEIQQLRATQIVAAPIDPHRLAQFADGAASTGFAPDTGAFPLAQFQQVLRAPAPLQPFAYRIRVATGAFTAPLMADPVSNEGEFWGEQICECVGALVLHDAMTARAPTRRRPASAPAYWTAIKAAVADVRAAGQTPMLVRASRSDPDWLADWHYHAATRPTDMTIVRAATNQAGYDFHLNDVPVYSSEGAGPATWIFGREILEEVAFQSFADGRPVAVTFKVDPTDPWQGELTVALSRRVKLGAGPLWRIQHPTPMP